MMLHKTKSRNAALLKYGLSLPLFGAMIVLSSATITTENIKEIERQLPITVREAFSSDAQNTTLIKSSDATEIASNEVLLSQKSEKATNIAKQSTSNLVISMDLENFQVDSGIYSTASVEVMPDYPGGIDKFLQWVGKNYKYPDAAKAAGVSGRIIVQFVVEKDGTLTNFKVPRDLGYGIGDAAKELLSQSLKWKPGIQNGKSVRVQYTLPLMLRSTDDQKSPAESLKLRADTVLLRINGTSTGKNPLIIIDGKVLDKPVSEGFKLNTADEKTTNEYLGIKPSDIKSIDVIKDGDALKKYGKKGKDGVILITTKASVKE